MRIYENGECDHLGSNPESLPFNPRDILSGGHYKGVMARIYYICLFVDVKECGHFCCINADYSTCCTCRERQSKCEVCSFRRKEK